MTTPIHRVGATASNTAANAAHHAWNRSRLVVVVVVALGMEFFALFVGAIMITYKYVVEYPYGG